MAHSMSSELLQLREMFQGIFEPEIVEDVWVGVKENFEKAFDQLSGMTDAVNVEDLTEFPCLPRVAGRKGKVNPVLHNRSGSSVAGTLPHQSQSRRAKSVDQTNRSSNDAFGEKVLHYLYTQKKVMVILYGLPGSGKSTLANAIRFDGTVVSADDYFVKNGKYRFQPKLLRLAHETAQQNAKLACQRGVTPVIIDNTNLTFKEMLPYATFAMTYGYDIELMTPNTPWKLNPAVLESRNVHRVPLSSIEKMMSKFEIVDRDQLTETAARAAGVKIRRNVRDEDDEDDGRALYKRLPRKEPQWEEEDWASDDRNRHSPTNSSSSRGSGRSQCPWSDQRSSCSDSSNSLSDTVQPSANPLPQRLNTRQRNIINVPTEKPITYEWNVPFESPLDIKFNDEISITVDNLQYKSENSDMQTMQASQMYENYLSVEREDPNKFTLLEDDVTKHLENISLNSERTFADISVERFDADVCGKLLEPNEDFVVNICTDETPDLVKKELPIVFKEQIVPRAENIILGLPIESKLDDRTDRNSFAQYMEDQTDLICRNLPALLPDRHNGGPNVITTQENTTHGKSLDVQVDDKMCNNIFMQNEVQQIFASADLMNVSTHVSHQNYTTLLNTDSFNNLNITKNKNMSAQNDPVESLTANISFTNDRELYDSAELGPSDYCYSDEEEEDYIVSEVEEQCKLILYTKFPNVPVEELHWLAEVCHGDVDFAMGILFDDGKGEDSVGSNLDNEVVRLTMQEASQPFQQKGMPNMKAIIMTQQMRAKEEEQAKLEIKKRIHENESWSTRMGLQHLLRDFPDTDRDVLQELFVAHGFSYHRTRETIVDSRNTAMYREEQKPAPTVAPEMSYEEQLDIAIRESLLLQKATEAKSVIPVRVVRPSSSETAYYEGQDTLDLHGRTKLEAVFIVHEFLKEKSKFFRSSLLRKATFDIITGQGKHSPDRYPHVKKAVEKFLELHNYKFREICNGGALRVFFRRLRPA